MRCSDMVSDLYKEIGPLEARRLLDNAKLPVYTFGGFAWMGGGLPELMKINGKVYQRME